MPSTDATTLRRLHAAHLRTVPFENRSILAGKPVVLDLERHVYKIVSQRRGGFCYELNGAFAFLLEQLGFEVELLSARVYTDDQQVGAPFEHVAIRVATDGDSWLVDVGFGHCFLFPLRMAVGSVQDDPHGRFDLRMNVDGDLDVLWEPGDGLWRPQYRLALAARGLEEFAERCEWQSTSPESMFTTGLICSRATEHGGATLFHGRLVEYSRGERAERVVPPGDEEIDVMRDLFGLEPD